MEDKSLKSLIRLIGVGIIFLCLLLLFSWKADGKHYDDVRIPNNGLISFYDFEGSQTGDPFFPDKVGKNYMKAFGFIEIIDGTGDYSWYSNLAQILGADGFSWMEIPFISQYNTKSFSIGFLGGFGTVGLDVKRGFGPWNLHNNYFWSWGDKIAMYITTETVTEYWNEKLRQWQDEIIDGLDEVDIYKYPLYTTHLRFGDKRYKFFTHDPEFDYNHYVVVYDGVNRVLMGYWEGQQHFRELNVQRPLVSGHPIRFGTDNKLANNISGRFEEIAFYNRPLTPSEVTRYFGGRGLKIKPKNKMAWTWGELKSK